MAAVEHAPPLERLAGERMEVDADTVGKLALALGSASAHIVPGVTDGQKGLLDAELDSRRVKQVQGKDYLAVHDVIRTANSIFGYGRWGYEVVELDYIGSTTKTSSDGNKQGCYVGYRCTVKLTVAGCLPVSGVGYGDGVEYQEQSPVTAHELAVKEAESDAIKRAFRNFGDQFGLILYAKADEKKRIAEDKAAEEYNQPAPAADVQAVLALAERKGKHGDVQPLIVTEMAENGNIVRSGKLAAIRARLEALPDGGQPKSAEPKQEPVAEAAPAVKPLPDGQAVALDGSVAACRMMAGRLGEAAVTWFDDKVEEQKAANAEAGYGRIIRQSWLDGAVTYLSQKLAEAGTPEGDVAELAPAEEPKAGDVAEAFGVGGGQKAA